MESVCWIGIIFILQLYQLIGTQPLPGHTAQENGEQRNEERDRGGGVYSPHSNGEGEEAEEERRGKRDLLDPGGSGILSSADSLAFEVPTLVRVNETSAPVDLQQDVKLVSGDERAEYGPPLNAAAVACLGSRKPPVQLSVFIDNVIPPDKQDRYVIKNSSELRGCGALFKMTLCETATSGGGCGGGFDGPLSELLLAAAGSGSGAKASPLQQQESFSKAHQSLIGSLNAGFQRKNKNTNGDLLKQEQEEDEEGEDQLEESRDQRIVQEVLKKMLSGTLKSPGAGELEDVSQPLTLLVKPSLLHKLTSSKSNQRSIGTRGEHIPKKEELDHLYKLLETLSTNLPSSKLVTLLSTLVSKISNDEAK